MFGNPWPTSLNLVAPNVDNALYPALNRCLTLINLFLSLTTTSSMKKWAFFKAISNSPAGDFKYLPILLKSVLALSLGN